MDKEELIEFLKENLKISLENDDYDYFGNNYKIKLSINDDEICETSFSIDYDNKFSC